MKKQKNIEIDKFQENQDKTDWNIILNIMILIGLIIVGSWTSVALNRIEKKSAEASLKLDHLSYENTELSFKLDDLAQQNQELMAQIKLQAVPFCKLTNSNGQVGVGIQPNKLKETCQ